LRRACTPPAVAHAPIVTSVRDISRTCRIRSASSAVVIEPSTRDTSYGPGWILAGGLQELRDLHPPGDRQQLILAVEQGELAAVAG
jgi:hypothetical protein